MISCLALAKPPESHLSASWQRCVSRLNGCYWNLKDSAQLGRSALLATEYL